MKRAHLIEQDARFEQDRYLLLHPVRLLVSRLVPPARVQEWLPTLIRQEASIGSSFAASSGLGHPARGMATSVELPNLVALTELIGSSDLGILTEEAMAKLVEPWADLLRVEGRHAEAVHWLERVEGLALVARSPGLRAATLFYRGVSEWHEATRLTSSLSEILMHPAYAQIIGMGREALPLIFRCLEREADHWGWALSAITGENPVPEAAEGDLEATRAAWLQWAQDHRIRW